VAGELEEFMVTAGMVPVTVAVAVLVLVAVVGHSVVVVDLDRLPNPLQVVTVLLVVVHRGRPDATP
jgi:hypothetical protein